MSQVNIHTHDDAASALEIVRLLNKIKGADYLKILRNHIDICIEEAEVKQKLAHIQKDLAEANKEADEADGKVDKKLFSWSWIGGGYNQTWAYTIEEATKIAEEMCSKPPGRILKPDLNTLKEEVNPDAYWENLPFFD